jgi:transcriptional regulator with XRE-family HTH domain
MESIGTKIKIYREKLNLTQEDLAEQLNMSASGYGKIERDETDIPFSRLQQIASLLKVKIGDLADLGTMKSLVENVNNNTGNNGVVFVNGLDNQERQLYTEQIKELKEQVDYLKDLITFLKEEIKKRS